MHEVEPQVGATVYKSSDGNLLFWLQEDSLVAFYIFYPATNELAIAKLSRINHVLPGLIYLADAPVPIVDSDNRTKVEENMNIVIENETLQFTARGRYRIVADLKSY